MINVAAHKLGHASGALPARSGDAFTPGSAMNPLAAEEGSIMEQDVSADLLGEEVREFSAEDAASLEAALNEPEE